MVSSWPPGLLVVTPLERVPVQAKVSFCVCPAQGHLIGSSKLYANGCKLCWAWRLLRDAKLTVMAICC